MKMLAVSCLVVGPIVGVAALIVTPTSGNDHLPPYSKDRSFPYHGSTFDSFVADSYKVAGRDNPQEFFDWMDKALMAKQSLTWNQWIANHRKSLAGLSGDQLTKAQIQTGADVHRAIKKAITKFSLDRGFEFTNTVSLCERQCYLQSIVIAGILQKVGLHAGVAMVYRNIEGQPSNNGHAVCVLKLADGRDIVVDASEPMPFPTHKGLMEFDTALGKYQYVEPTYAADASITAYTRTDTRASVKPTVEAGLDVPFLNSQFDYYRGERAIDGILAKNPTPAGLASSARFFERSQKENPRNPLTVYMLGRTYVKQGRTADAKKQFQAAGKLYTTFGWVPDGVKQALSETQ